MKNPFKQKTKSPRRTAVKKNGRKLPVPEIEALSLSPAGQAGDPLKVAETPLNELDRAEKVADELERSHSLLQAALESTADGLLVVDLDGRITQFNRKFVEMWHIPPALLSGGTDSKAIAQVLDQLKDPDGFLAGVKALYSQPEAESFDLLDFKDGRTFERYSQPHRLGDKIVGRVWSFRDITARKQAELALSQSEARLRALVEEIPAIIYTESADEPGKTLYISPQIEPITGYTPAEWMLSPNFWEEIVHPDDLDYMRSEDERTNLTGEPYRVEYRIVKRDGTFIWILDEAVLVRDNDGKALFWQGVMHDISDKKQAEKAQQESETRFISIFKTSPIGISITSLPNGRIIEVNPAFLNMFGFTQDEVLGRSLLELNAWRKSDTLLTKLLTGGQIRNLEMRFHRKSGETGNLLLSADVVELGGQPHMISVMQDITERKHTEEELGSKAQELRRRNEELARLYRATGSLISGASLNIEEQAQRIVEVVQQEFGQDNCSLFVVERGSNELVRLAAAGTYANQLKDTKFTLEGPGLIACALRNGEILNVPDVHADARYVANWEAAQSELTIPLKIGTNVIGVIDVQSLKFDAFSPDDERLMSIFAERAALGLEHSRLNTQTDSRIQQLVALRMVDMAISGSFDINLTLGVLLDQIIGQMGIHAADILIFNSTTQTFKFSCERGFRLQTLRHVQIKYGSGFVWQVIRQRRVINVEDITSGPDGLQRLPDLSTEHFFAYIGIPLIAKGQIKAFWRSSTASRCGSSRSPSASSSCWPVRPPSPSITSSFSITSRTRIPS
jgi:PAS domain S-box-containing protein